MANEIDVVTTAQGTDTTKEAVVVAKDVGPQLTNDQQALFIKVRGEIMLARENKGFDFLRQAGRILLQQLWEGDATRIDKNHPLFVALGKDRDLRVSQSNLWYAVRLQDPEALFGEIAARLSTSHQKRLLHVAESKRQELARSVVEDNLTVEQLEARIQKGREPAAGKSKRGAKALPISAKQFSAVGSKVKALLDQEVGDLKGLDVDRAKTMHGQVQDLKQLVETWLPGFEKELARVAGIGA